MKRFLARISRHPIGILGAALATAAGILFPVLLAIEFLGHEGSPYIGILTFLIVPGILVVGLVLIPIGVTLVARREKAGEDQGQLPVLDFNKPALLKALLVFVGLTVVNLSILGVGTYKGVEVMESTEFCGTTCHDVMIPEYTAYQRSPHSRVDCVDCHIGPGADWFVKSKLSGAWQVVSVTFGLYPEPIPTPIHNLRPARDTCEQCHWPEKFHGDLLRVLERFDEDEANTPETTVLLMRVGGVAKQGGQGIHWHVDPDVRIRYLADEQRTTIPVVEMTTGDGEVTVFKSEDAPDVSVAEAEGLEWRLMDCLDCHNRPSHAFSMPDHAVDDAIAAGRIPRDLPFVKREGVRLLQGEYGDAGEARRAILDGLRAFYRTEYPEVAATKRDAIENAGDVLTGIWSTNVFPGMKVTWGTYPVHIGHEAFPGCFRCHNDEHVSEDGRTISQDCETCHALLAYEEEDPEVLELMGQ